MIRWLSGNSCSRKPGRDVNSIVLSFIKDFVVLKVKINFKELIKYKKERVWAKGFFV